MTSDPGALVTALRALRRYGFVDDEFVLWRQVKAILDAAEAMPETPDWMPSSTELANYVILYRKLQHAVNALEPATDDEVSQEWMAKRKTDRLTVINAAIRLVRESNVSRGEAVPET